MKTLAADEHMVGYSAICTQATFKKLLDLSKGPEMEDWSDVLAKLIERAGVK